MAKTFIHGTPKVEPWNPSPKLQLVRQQLFNVVKNFLSKAAVQAGDAAEREAKKYMKIGEEDLPERIARAAADAITWDILVPDVQADLQAVAEQASQEALFQLEIFEGDMFDVADRIAADYASQRAAEMVGRKVVGGQLVDNPDAKWVISQTTRDDIRDVVQQAFLERSSVEGIKQQIEQSATFSEYRADMVARTEVAATQIQSNLEMWRRTGMVRTVNVVLSSLHVVVDECDDVVAGNPYPIDSVPLLPLHPICRCGLVAAEIVEA